MRQKNEGLKVVGKCAAWLVQVLSVQCLQPHGPGSIPGTKGFLPPPPLVLGLILAGPLKKGNPYDVKKKGPPSTKGAFRAKRKFDNCEDQLVTYPIFVSCSLWNGHVGVFPIVD